MPERIDLFDSTYGHFSERVVEAVRKETFGTDIGQNSWTTIEEYDQFLPWLALTPDHHVLEVASGSGGPALYLAGTTGCRITGIDSNEEGVATASGLAARSGQVDRARFAVADANARLPFDDDSFDGIVCIDALNHLPDRVAIFREWRRVLRPGGRALFTDPVVITGGVTNDELATRSSIGLFLFVPPGLNERFIAEAGLELVRLEDATANAALVSGRWHAARARHRDALLGIEGEERFAGLQRFFAAVHRLTSERRLSRMMYLARKPVG
ncbi:class I SAM-dependent methyltransferase [Inquilinus sp. CA228]|uniref:class I SAM-dependent methyltransferase n=1 Tax=Inquilinus sp. CA228 TaxID=3455609 RepID=UPI003F8D154D